MLLPIFAYLLLNAVRFGIFFDIESNDRRTSTPKQRFEKFVLYATLRRQVLVEPKTTETILPKRESFRLKKLRQNVKRALRNDTYKHRKFLLKRLYQQRHLEFTTPIPDHQTTPVLTVMPESEMFVVWQLYNRCSQGLLKAKGQTVTIDKSSKKNSCQSKYFLHIFYINC